MYRFPRKCADFGEVDDFVLAWPQDRPVQVHILAPHGERLQTTDRRLQTFFDFRLSAFPHRLPKPVAPNLAAEALANEAQPQAFATLEIEGDVAEAPELRWPEAVGIRLWTIAP